MKNKFVLAVLVVVICLGTAGPANALTIDTVTGNWTGQVSGYDKVVQSFTVDSTENYFDTAKFLFSGWAGTSFDVAIKSDPFASGSLFTAQVTPQYIGNALWGVLDVGMAFAPGSTIYVVFDFTGFDTSTTGSLRYMNDSFGAGYADGIASFILNGSPWDGGGIYDLGFIAEFKATPIPGAVWLLGSGLLGLVGIRRKKKA